MEEIPPKELNAYISEFIITVRKKDNNRRRLRTQLLTFFDGQFWTVLKEEEFNISVKSLNQSPTFASSETEMKSTTRYKRLNVLDSDSE